MIVSLDEVKAYCNIKDNSKDSSITNQIEEFTDFIFQYCNNEFLDKNVSYQGNIIFNQDKTITITDSFHELYFRNGITIKIKNTVLNNGIYTITNVNNGIITVLETLENETVVDGHVFKVVIPKSIINVLKDLIKNSLSPGIKSKSLGDRSWTYDEKVVDPYNVLNKYRIVRMA